MPKFVEMSVTDVVHESEIFGAAMPPEADQRETAEDAEAESD